MLFLEDVQDVGELLDADLEEMEDNQQVWNVTPSFLYSLYYSLEDKPGDLYNAQVQSSQGICFCTAASTSCMLHQAAKKKLEELAWIILPRVSDEFLRMLRCRWS